ncbi:hypothetical protein KIN20_031233 [Parelaphostrongylus tenuis]|uniref:Uncharacterized protein n=1 Tax=Parelaphostrongylus tenuis TaxID=148309 RepID=A0AAD5R591_PARTN|nr:hypothetical protein KIN20_031233 [Parelaphostrongylus tenuis]
MTMLALLIALITLSVFAKDPNNPFECDGDNPCPSGSKCENGTCHARLDCPMVMMANTQPGCEMILVPDERDCPMPKIVCDKHDHN